MEKLQDKNTIFLMGKPEMSRSPQNAKQPTSLEDYELVFDDAIATPTVRTVFSEFLKKSFVHESLEFYEHVLEFEKAVNEMTVVGKTVASKARDAGYARSAGGKSSTSNVMSSVPSSLSSLQSPIQILLDQAQTIINRYVADGSQKEVNLPGDVKRAVFEELEKARMGNISIESEDDSEEDSQCEFETIRWKQIFSSAKRVVMISLKLDNWPRFTRSKMWLNFIQDKWQKHRSEAIQILEQAGLNKEQVESNASKIFFTKDELFSSYVLEKDIEFIRQMSEDSSDWEMVYADKNGNQGFFNERQYFKNVNDKGQWAMVKNVVYLPFNYNLVYCSQSSAEFGENDPLIFELAQYAYYKPVEDHRYSTTIYAARLKTGVFFLSNRVVPTACTAFFEPEEKRLTAIHRPALDASIPAFKRHVVASGWYSYIYEHVSENVCRHTQIYYINLGGWLKKANKKLFRDITKKRGSALQVSMEKLARGYYKTGKYPINDDPMGEIATLEDNCRAQLPQEQWPEFLQPLNPDQSEDVRWYPDRREEFSGEKNVKKLGLRRNILTDNKVKL